MRSVDHRKTVETGAVVVVEAELTSPKKAKFGQCRVAVDLVVDFVCATQSAPRWTR